MVVSRRLPRVLVSFAVCGLVAVACTAGNTAPTNDQQAGDPADSEQLESTTSSTSSSSTTNSTTSSTTTTTIPEPEAVTDPAVLAEFVSANNGEWTLGEPIAPVLERAPGEGKDIFGGFFVDQDSWTVFQTLGLIEPTADSAVVDKHRSDTVRGVCCPVALWDNDDHPLLRSIVAVHELTHLADLRRTTRQSLDPARFHVMSWEQVSLINVAIEGNANRVGLLYVDELVARGANPERFDVDWGGPGIPDVMVKLREFPYLVGAEFMEELADRMGIDALDLAFDRPPASSEQVYDVDAYLSEELPLDVPLPTVPTQATRVQPEFPPGILPVDQRVTLGAFVIHVLAEQTMSTQAARELAISWAGDSGVVYDLPDQRCIEATIVMDNTTSAAQLLEVFRAASIDAELVDSESSTFPTVAVAPKEPKESGSDETLQSQQSAEIVDIEASNTIAISRCGPLPGVGSVSASQ